MIVVIADDLSGAAELANAAVAAGFSAEVQMCGSTPPIIETGAASVVICLDTDTRSLAPEKAGVIAGEIARRVAAVHPALVYKKCDSVLRGAVAAESLAIARAFGKTRVLLVPANPSRRRIIRDGEYFVDGVPLAQTAFANDPEHPRRSSRVAELVGHVPGIETPDTVSAADLDRHAANADATTLPAGGVDFFNAILKLKSPALHAHPDAAAPRSSGGFVVPPSGGPDGPLQQSPAGAEHQKGAMPVGNSATPKHRVAPSPAPLSGSSLFVCGSHAAWLAGRSDHCAAHGIPAFPMPRDLFEPELCEDVLVRWAGEAATALRENGAALLAIGESGLAGRAGSPLPAATPLPPSEGRNGDRLPNGSPGKFDVLADRLADAVQRVLASSPAARVLLEGGATASAVLHQLGLRRFSARLSPGPGVGALLPLGQSGPLFLIKPGSYPWPDSVWPTHRFP